MNQERTRDGRDLGEEKEERKRKKQSEAACFRVFCAACWRTMSQERTRMEETWEKKRRKEKGKSKAKPRVFVCFVLRAGGR